MFKRMIFLSLLMAVFIDCTALLITGCEPTAVKPIPAISVHPAPTHNPGCAKIVYEPHSGWFYDNDIWFDKFEYEVGYSPTEDSLDFIWNQPNCF